MEHRAGKEAGVIQIEITSDISEVERRLGNLSRKANMVMKQAANSAMKNASSDVKKEMAKRYHVLQRNVANTIKTEKATTGKPYAKIVSSAKHSNLIRFHVVQSRSWKKMSGRRVPKFYLASVMKKKSSKPLAGEPKPFIATTKKGFRGVFVRKSVSGRKIRGVGGPAIPQMIQNREIMSVIRGNANKELFECIDKKIQGILQKGR